jgi:hypothetical protein
MTRLRLVPLHHGAAGNPRLRRARLDDHPPAVSELNGDNLRQVPGTEQHAYRASTQVAAAPVSKEGITEHGDQYPRPRPRQRATRSTGR